MEEGDDDGEEEGGGVSGDRPPAPNKTAPKKAASASSSASAQQPQQWEWESVRNKLRDALTEMSVLSDVITVATKVSKTIQGGPELMVMDLVMLTLGCYTIPLGSKL